eukprot:COSAG02_NODE_2662_length_8303_cov_7.299976_8_plen_113_part_00
MPAPTSTRVAFARNSSCSNSSLVHPTAVAYWPAENLQRILLLLLLRWLATARFWLAQPPISRGRASSSRRHAFPFSRSPLSMPILSAVVTRSRLLACADLSTAAHWQLARSR